MSTPERPFRVPHIPNLPPQPTTVSRIVENAVRGVLGRLGNEVADAQAHRESGGRWSTVLRLGRRAVDDGQGGLTEPAEIVIAAVADGRLAELLGTSPVEILDSGPTVTISATIPGHLAPAVRAAILAAAPDATVTSPRRSTERTLTITTPQAPKNTDTA